MNNQISDDTSLINAIFKEMKANLTTFDTRCIQFRKKTLQSLLKGYQEMIGTLDEALEKDLGTNAHVNMLLNHAGTIQMINQMINHIDQWAQPIKVNTPESLGSGNSKIQYEPLGLVLIISAWNFPITTSIQPLIGAIAAGNSVILKPSQFAPYCSNFLNSLFLKYLDQRYYRVIEGKIEVGKALSQLPFDMICFTGSSSTGKIVAVEASKKLIPCILELGGKCPVIVDETADLESAAIKTIFGKFANCGQTCIGVDHVYVHQSVATKFKSIIVKIAEEMYGGKDLTQGGMYGKIINKHHFNRLLSSLNEKHGGKVIFGGKTISQKLHIDPTIIQSPKQTSLLMTEQVFGPILPIVTYTKIQQVVNKIRQGPKPLAIYYFSQNQKRVNEVKNSTSSGSFVANHAVMQKMNQELPFGGVGGSGYGRYHGKWGLIAFSNPKSILIIKSSL